MGYLSKNEIVIYDFVDAVVIVENLMKNGYVCMLSREENLYIINYELGTYNEYYKQYDADRNGVVFRNREEFENERFEENV